MGLGSIFSTNGRGHHPPTGVSSLDSSLYAGRRCAFPPTFFLPLLRLMMVDTGRYILYDCIAIVVDHHYSDSKKKKVPLVFWCCFCFVRFGTQSLQTHSYPTAEDEGGGGTNSSPTDLPYNLGSPKKASSNTKREREKNGVG